MRRALHGSGIPAATTTRWRAIRIRVSSSIVSRCSISRTSRQARRRRRQDYKDLVRDIQQNTLPQVVFYKPIGQYDEHPGYTNVTDGDRHLAELMPMLLKSPAYKDMLIIITYDENGGAWDHVAPPRRDRWGPGTRIPLVFVGPTVKRSYVDHTPYDFNSILRTLEVRFGLEPLTDADANAYPMRNALRP